MKAFGWWESLCECFDYHREISRDGQEREACRGNATCKCECDQFKSKYIQISIPLAPSTVYPSHYDGNFDGTNTVSFQLCFFSYSPQRLRGSSVSIHIMTFGCGCVKFEVLHLVSLLNSVVRRDRRVNCWPSCLYLHS